MKTNMLSKKLLNILLLLLPALVISLSSHEYGSANETRTLQTIGQDDSKSIVRRAFKFEGKKPDTLVFTGQADHQKISSTRTQTQFSVSIQTLYSVSLYLDENGGRKIFEPIKWDELSSVLKGPKVHRDILSADFPKAVVLAFSNTQSARTVRNDFIEHLGKVIRVDAVEVLRFLNCVSYVKKEFLPKDEIIIRILDNKKIVMTTCGQDLPEIESEPLSRAILSIWIGRNKLSANESGLLSRAKSILR